MMAAPDVNPHAITRRELGAGALCTWVASLAAAAAERKAAGTSPSGASLRWRDDFQHSASR